MCEALERPARETLSRDVFPDLALPVEAVGELVLQREEVCCGGE